MVNYMLLVDLPYRTLLIRSARLFTEKLNTALNEFELNYSQWVVLHVIHDAKQCSLVEIAKVLGISQPAVTKRVFELEQKQLIRFISTQDRREKIVALNTTGEDVYIRGQKFLDEVEQTYCAGIPKEDFMHVQNVLKQFLTNLEHEVN